MSEEETKFLNRQRGAVKSKLTLFSNHLRTLEGKSLSEAELINLEERISKADTIFADFDKLQNQIQNVVSESEIESQYQERSIFEDTFFATIARAKQMVLTYKKEHEQQISANASTSGSSNHDENNVQVLKGVKFPVISLPNFDGNMDNWLEFRDTFQSLIHDNGLINNIQKYHYLRACLTNGASQVIRSIELSASNYPVAWETLCERYNNNQLLVHIHTKALFNLEPIQKECASKLRNLLDNVSKHLRSLQQLGEPTDQWDTLINYLVTTKLDSKTTREWEQHKIVIIGICWFAGTMVGFLPLLGWHKKPADDYCFFLNVMQPNYLVFLYFGTIITPALLLAAFYTHIYQVVLKQLRNIVTMHPEKGSSIRGDLSGGMIRVLGVHQTNEVKATQNLAIIVLFFMICWFPLYTINCIIAFNPDFYVPSTVMLCSIILSHLNSAGNPLLYAYHLKDFRAALKNFFLTLFGRQRCSEPVDKNRLKTSRREATDRGRLVLPQKMAAVVKTSAAVAVATTGEVNRGIWNISEHSLSSSDSLKSVDSVVNQEKCCLMMRPATPYRPRAASDFNPVFKGLAQDDESDDGFNEEETLPYHDYGLDVDCKLEGHLSQAQTTRTVPSGRKRSLSSSSPQISIGVYYVEGDRMTLQAVPPNEGSSRGLDTLLVVDLLRRDRHLNRSLSDSGRPCSGSTLKLKGVVHSFGS